MTTSWAFSSRQDFATNLLRSTNMVQRDLRARSSVYGRNHLEIDTKQADQLHSAMHYNAGQYSTVQYYAVPFRAI